MSTSLVIGGNGFIGSYLTDALAAQGQRVRAFDRFSDGRTRFSANGVEKSPGDFLNTADLAKALEGVSVVYHFLSTTTPATAQRDPLVDIRTNLTGSVDLFRLCVDAGVEHVFFASTGGAIYGDTGAEVLAEEHATLPISPYAIGKQALEGYLRYFERSAGLASTILRISNPYGVRQQAQRRQGVIPIFLRHVARREPIVIYGDGSMTRDFIFADDVAALVARLHGGQGGATYNVGSGAAYSINQVIDVIEQVTGLSVQREYVSQPSTFVQSVVLDNSKLLEAVGQDFRFTPLVEGVAATWEAINRESYAA